MQSSSVSGSGRPGKHIEDGARYEYNFMNPQKTLWFPKKGNAFRNTPGLKERE